MLKRLLFVALLALASVAQATVYSLPWGPLPQFVDANGAPMSNGSLLTFAGGSSTPQVTYTDSTGSVANPTTITLNTRGETPNQVWLTGGQTYKFVLKDSSGSTIWTVDQVSGVNDTTSSVSEWIAGPAPTYVSATSFTLAGDQTTTFTVGRRLKTTNSGGTVYSSIVTSVFGASTTVTVVNDSGSLDSGLSAVSYGILQATNKSVPPFDGVTWLTTVAGTNTITASASKSTAPLATGQAFRFTPAGTNTGATTLNVNGLAAKNVFAANSALVGGELHANIPVEVVYDGTQFQLQGPITKQPTRTVLTSGSGATYTTPTGATRINVRMVGGGGGAGAQSANNGTAGNNTTFSTLTASGGGAGNAAGGAGGGGGAASGGDINIPGGGGQAGEAGGAAGIAIQGGQGGASAFGGNGSGGTPGNAGGNGATNSGGGGGGGGGNATLASGGGGGAGGYVEKLITSPAATYTYTVGASANGGAAGGNAGGNGAAGIIIVDESYNFKQRCIAEASANDENYYAPACAADDAAYRLRRAN